MSAESLMLDNLAVYSSTLAHRCLSVGPLFACEDCDYYSQMVVRHVLVYFTHTIHFMLMDIACH